MRKFFVSTLPGTWDSTEWSATSGGPPGLSAPGLDETAVFDLNSSKCLIDTTVSIADLLLQSNFESTLSQESYPITVSNDASMLGGHFLGGGANIHIGDDLTINRCNVISTDRTFEVEGDLYYREDPFDQENIYVEEITLSAADATNKNLSLAFPPTDASKVVLNILNGVPQRFGIDYVSYGITVDWSGLTLDGDLAQNDIVRVIYTAQETDFAHNGGLVTMKSNGNTLSGGGIRFHNLKVSQDGSSYFRVDSSSNIENSLYLESGKFLEGSDATLKIQGDLTCASGFGVRGEGTGVFIVMDGSGTQKVISDNAILPSFGVDKTTSAHVMAWGTSPIRIDGNLEIVDGTFNTNNRDVEVGIV